MFFSLSLLSLLSLSLSSLSSLKRKEEKSIELFLSFLNCVVIVQFFMVWRRSKCFSCKEAILHKEFSGIHFLTNGYDYWFSQKVDLPKACVLTLMDYFNCMIGEVAFRKLVKFWILLHS